MSHPVSTEDVLKAEVVAIHGSGTEHLVSGKTGSALYQALNGLESAALCLSGGGIRSAAFALGVLQAFAIHPRSSKGEACQQAKDSLLVKFHYFSTVSGGGYIGSWLAAWRTRAEFPTIWAGLTGRPGGADVEPHSVAWLRSFSNYLTPKLGVMSADAWTDIALFVRNLILNWLIIIPLVCALILFLKVVAVVAEWATHYDDWLQYTFAGCGVLCLLAALAFTTRHRPSRRSGDGLKGGVGQNTYLFYGLLWSVLSAALLAQFLASDLVGLDLLSSCHRGECPCLGNADSPPYGDPCQGVDGYLVPRWPMMQFIWLGMLAGGAIYALSWLLGRPRKMDVRDFACWSAAGCVYGAAVALGLYFYVQVPDQGIGIFSTVVMPIVFGVPWILVSQTVADMIFVGLSSYAPKAEDDREWLGRTGGWIIAAALGWFTLTFLAFFGAVFSWDDVWTAVPAWIAPLGGVSGLATAFLGSAGFTRARGPAKGVKSLSANLILSIVAPIFAAALIISLSLVLDQLLLGENLVPDIFIGWQNDWSDRAPTVQSLGLGFIFFFATAFVASLFININRFSLHALYRNRLVRAFLGASRDRKADPFTDFDDNDNPEMQSLWPPANPSGGMGDGGWAPFPVVNTTLNIVAAKKLAWQERKAASFTMTPLHCGYSSKCPANSDKPEGAFRASADFGGCITLGTAMAISGAAASPNMGYHSSPGITFLMTLFNVRLGWWLGNTAEEGNDTFMRDGPLFAIVPLAQETFGRTTDDKRYIYLSDGGHFENLGLYEMVRRRCRFIVVSDAGCDPDFKFEDLGNAVRKIAIDLGVAIRFSKLDALKPRPEEGDVGPGHDYHAIGEIDYDATDKGTAQNGIILYIKAGYHGVESAGVRAYAMANADFPHQSTLNQWFSESQFESYRALGFEITDGILSTALKDEDCTNDPSLKNIFEALRKTKGTPGSFAAVKWNETAAAGDAAAKRPRSPRARSPG